MRNQPYLGGKRLIATATYGKKGFLCRLETPQTSPRRREEVSFPDKFLDF